MEVMTKKLEDCKKGLQNKIAKSEGGAVEEKEKKPVETPKTKCKKGHDFILDDKVPQKYIDQGFSKVTINCDICKRDFPAY